MATTKKRSRDFGKTKTIEDFEPLDFTLNGETFICKPAIQGGTLLEFVADADSDDGGRAAGALYRFFASAMPEDEYTKFKAMCESENTIIEMDTIGEIASWLVEEYTARPTQPASS